MTSEGAHHSQLTSAKPGKTRVSWYPGRRALLVNGIDGRAYRVEVASGDQTLIESELSGFQDAAIGPDGRHITFSLSTSGSVDDNNIWLMDSTGQTVRKVTSMARLQHEPAWHPSGNSIYFLSGDGGQNHDIWKLSTSTFEARQITANNVYHFDVSIAKDGRLAYSNNRDGQYDIWIRQGDGTEIQLTDDTALDARPSWSPDGRFIAFESTRSGELEIWKVDVMSGELTQLTQSSGEARYPVWAPSGSHR